MLVLEALNNSYYQREEKMYTIEEKNSFVTDKINDIRSINLPFSWDNSKPLMFPHPDPLDSHFNRVWMCPTLWTN